MTLTEIIIIYLTFGAPVAVYHFQLRRKTHGAHVTSFSAARAFLFWPVALFKILRTSVGADKINDFADHSISDATDDLLLHVIELAKGDLDRRTTGMEIGPIREMLERYAGLFRASCHRGSGRQRFAEFYLAAGHPKPEIAAACRMRHTDVKLTQHCEAASAEVRRFFSDFAASPALTDALAALARDFGDEPTVSAFDRVAIDKDSLDSPSLKTKSSKPARAA